MRILVDELNLGVRGVLKINGVLSLFHNFQQPMSCSIETRVLCYGGQLVLSVDSQRGWLTTHFPVIKDSL